MASLLPVCLTAQESAGAMLRTSGTGTLVNQAQAPASSAIFPNDLIQTQKDSVARIELTGSDAQINPETIVQFQQGELVLDHGSLSVNTSRGVRVRVGCITVTPVHDNMWTHYDVKDVSGKVTVSSMKDDVYIDARKSNFQDAKEQERSRSIVHETEQKTRDERCGGADYSKPAQVAALGDWLNSPPAIIAGFAAIVFTTCYALCRSSEPLSPACPSNKSCMTPGPGPGTNPTP
jgi:hypothetical protein